MTRRSKATLGILTIAIVGPSVAWRALRQKPALEFMGAKPPATLLGRSLFEGNPWIDLNLPGGNQIVFPKKRKLTSGKVDPAVAAYLRYDDPSPASFDYFVTDRLKVGNDVVGLPVTFMDEPVKGATRPPIIPGRSSLIISARAVSSRLIMGIPYATDEAYRDATLLHDQGEYPVRLSVSHEFGSSIRRAETFPIGSWQVFAKPRTWKLTTQDVTFDLSTNAPAGTKFLFRPKWKSAPAASYPWSYDPDRPWILEGGAKAVPFVIRRAQPTSAFAGEIVELEASKVVLQAKRPKRNNLRLYLPNGNLIYENGSPTGLAKNDLIMLDVRGKRLSEDYWPGLRNDDPYTFGEIAKGENVTAVAYRAKHRFPIEGKFDVPPPFVPNGQYLFFSGGNPGYVYIRTP